VHKVNCHHVSSTNLMNVFYSILGFGGIYMERPCNVKWVPVTTAWRVLGLRMEERPPGMEGSCEYIE
jgi:hypothetical protein